ncbi:MAG: hypothetical protein EA365_16830 [Gloeocapsa sp. DLM2.Bin57]|nr:MAG: hypothetical protein EA365_16830 [Gloeocapsa sp. DLM2.Bin57]
MTIIKGFTVADWFNNNPAVETMIANPAGNGDTDIVTVNRDDDYSSFSSVFDAPSRDGLISSTAPVTVTVASPNNPGITAEFGPGPTFGIGVNTTEVIGKPGITTAPEEIGYYQQITTADKGDSLTIQFNRQYSTGGTDSGIVFSYFYSGENGTGEVMSYQLFDDGELQHTGTIRAEDTSTFDWQNIPNATRAGVFHYKFSSDNVVKEFDEIRIIAGDGLNPDGTDALLEAIVATDVGPATPDEDPDPITPVDGLINFKPTSNPSAFNFTGNGVVPAAIMGNGTLNLNNVDRTSVRLAFDLDELLAGNGVAPNRFNRNLEDLNADGFVDLQFFFGTASLRSIKDQIPAGADPDNIPLFISFKIGDQLFVGSNPIDDPVKVAGGL